MQRSGTVAAAVLLALVVLSGCNASDNSAMDDALIVGTVDKVTALDPAGSYDAGSFVVQNQVFALLMNNAYGSADAVPDLAESASFTGPQQFTVVMKPDLTFANGNLLTTSDVKFSFDRQLAISDQNGPSSVLQNLDRVVVVDGRTVDFYLKNAHDQTFAQVLASQAGFIMDEESVSATSVTSDDDLVAANAFSGQYRITSYSFNNLIAYQRNKAYGGMLPAALTKTAVTKFYVDSSNLRMDIETGAIDAEFRNLSATDTEDLRSNQNVHVVTGAGGEVRDIVFNFNSMPFGATTENPDSAKALAVRQAVAHLVDRAELADEVYKKTYAPLYSYVPVSVTGGNESMLSAYGDGRGGPDATRAQDVLLAAGITDPVTLHIQYNIGHYGPSSSDEYALIKDQLESSGLFKVHLQATEWVQYSKDRVADAYPMYQLGWFPDFNDPDNYLSPLYLPDSYHQNHFSDAEATALILQQSSEVNSDVRHELVGAAQDRLAEVVPAVPLLVGESAAVVGTDITGVASALDSAYRFRYAPLEKH